jgi:cyclophilin family peptidyl-prolyl cis-trans isomerase
LSNVYVRFERNDVLDQFLALQRDLMGRFPWEVNLIDRPIVPEVARFTAGVEAWRAGGIDNPPAWLATAGRPAQLVARARRHLPDSPEVARGTGLVAGALEAAAPALRRAIGTLDAVRTGAATETLRMLGAERIADRFVAALNPSFGDGDAVAPLPIYLVPFTPHSPGAGFLGDGAALTAGYIDARRFRGSVLAEIVLTLIGWTVVRRAPAAGTLAGEIADRLPGAGPYHRRLRAVLAKTMIEQTAGHLVSAVAPGHRRCVEALGTAWRYPRLHAVVGRHWPAYLDGSASRADALSAIARGLSRHSPRWFVDHVDAASLAADFYLLEWLAAGGDAGSRQRLARWLPRLARYLASQLDVIIGTELGHYERARSPQVPEPLGRFLERVTEGDSRLAWPRVRQEIGQPAALRLAQEAFAGPGAVYGGGAWAPVAAVLRRYVCHEIPHTLFVDQCMTLEHNNGSLFDKFFDTEDLPRVLDAHAAGDLPTLGRYASPEVRRLLSAVEPPRAGTGWYELALGGAPPGALGCGCREDPAGFRADRDALAGRPIRVRPRRRKEFPTWQVEPYTSVEVSLLTTAGALRLWLWPQVAPCTVDNFVRLATGACRWREPATGEYGVGGFFDGTTFHRRLPGFLIQGGDRTGTGDHGPGYRIPDEISIEYGFDRAFLVGMANVGPNTSGSQFFITLAAAEHLTGAYTQFGEVADDESKAVATAISESVEPVSIVSTEVTRS